MNKTTKKLTIISSCIVILLGIFASPRVTIADEISVTGNGSSTNNTVTVSTSQQTTTQQTNNSQVTNTTNTSANTGGNTVSNNTGTAGIKTGDATSTTSVNTAANASTVLEGCGCSQDSSATVTGNGADSKNSVNSSSASDTNVSLDQTANLTNSVSQSAVTGRNEANNNNGNTSIKTGNITAQVAVKNGPVNIVNVTILATTQGPFTIKIAGNGANSVSTVIFNENNNSEVAVSNNTSVINNLIEKYITGENSANYANGNVTIVTGDVLNTTSVENGPINASSLAVSCSCQKEHTKPNSPTVPSPAQPVNNSIPASSSSTSNSNSSGPSTGGPGSVLGAVANTLPVTGSYWFFIAFIGNIMMMLFGWYLRLRSGRSPGYAYTS